ncbi:MAG: helix-turn-helix domain-containing protein [Steroidobacteraceae bacterium]
MLTLRAALPAPHLRDWVRHVQQRDAQIQQATLVYPVAARSDVFLEFYLGDRYRVRALGADTLEDAPAAVIVGPASRRTVDLVLQGHFKVFTIHFQPTALHHLFGLPMRELADRAYDARTVLGPFARQMQERLSEAATFEARVSIVDSMLERCTAERSSIDPVSRLANRLLPAKGALRIDAAAAGLGLSVRQFERRFASQVGMTPRLYANVVRFQAALGAKRAQADRSWRDIAHAMGFHDQMHMVRDFRRFAAVAPNRFVAQLTSMPERW